MVICFNGIDGSGKSLQAHRLVSRLNEAGYPAVYVWNGSRGPLTNPLTMLGKRLLKAPKRRKPAMPVVPGAGAQYHAYLESTQRLFKHPLLRNVWLKISILEHAGEIWAAILPHLAHNRIIVCDRYIYDSIVSMSVLAGVEAAALPKMLRVPVLCRVPRPAKWFFLDVPAAVAFDRKDDIVDIEFLERRVPLYQMAAQTLGMQSIDGTASPDDIAALVWQSVQTILPQPSQTALSQK